MKVECICINAKNKPDIIPDSLWVKEKQPYHITHVYWSQSSKTQGCTIAEHDISAYVPFGMYRLDRFAYTEENLLKLIELMKECTMLNDIEITELIKDLEICTQEQD